MGQGQNIGARKAEHGANALVKKHPRRVAGASKKPRETEGGLGAVGGLRLRTCVGCGQAVDVRELGPAALLRLVVGPGGEVVVDAGNSRFGRGVYVHPRPDCVQKAAQRGLAKASKGQARSVRTGPEASAVEPLSARVLSDAIRRAMEARVLGLLASALRTKTLSAGAEAAAAAYEQGAAKLLVVARDAAAGAELTAVRKAISEGNAVAWGSKESLANACAGHHERMRVGGISVLALSSPQIAQAVREAVHAAQAMESLDRDEAGATRPTKTSGRRACPPERREGFTAREVEGGVDSTLSETNRQDETRSGSVGHTLRQRGSGGRGLPRG